MTKINFRPHHNAILGSLPNIKWINQVVDRMAGSVFSRDDLIGSISEDFNTMAAALEDSILEIQKTNTEMDKLYAAHLDASKGAIDLANMVIALGGDAMVIHPRDMAAFFEWAIDNAQGRWTCAQIDDLHTIVAFTNKEDATLAALIFQRVEG